MAIFGAFMVNSFLSFAATNAFKIAYMGVGPTEVRLFFILINTVLILVGRERMLDVLPHVLVLAAFGLFITVYRTQKMLWAIDMKTKYGDAPDPGTTPTSKDLARELTIGVRKRRLIPNLALCILIAGGAVTVLAMRVAYPYHRIFAFGLYLLSWVPLLLSFREKRAFIRRNKAAIRQKVRPYLLHIAVAVVMLTVGRSAWVLAPGTPGIAAGLSDHELTQSITQDVENLHILDINLKALVRYAEQDPLFTTPVTSLTDGQLSDIREFWVNVTDACLELEVLRRRYRDFTYVDYLVKPELHAHAFFIAFSAFVIQYDASLALAEALRTHPLLETLLNEPDPKNGLPANSYASMVLNLTHPDELLRLNAGAAYLLLVRKDLSMGHDLPAMVESRLASTYKTLGRRPHRLVDAPLDALESAAFRAWFPFQKSVAIKMSHIRTTQRENFVTPELLKEQRPKLQPGDILLERRNWFMTNVGIPGFWPHAALYLGTAETLDSFFADIPALEGRRASDVLAEAFPEAVGALRGEDEKGPYSVIEARRDGVVFSSLEASANADYVAALRPQRVARAERFKAIRAALSHYGKPYDYNFDFATDSVLVCSELVFKSYREAKGLDFELSHINGRPILPPNRIARKYDLEYGSETQQLELVFFLDGNEKAQTAVLADKDSFKSSWQRPKWDVMQE